jgi:hypothetical protein
MALTPLRHAAPARRLALIGAVLEVTTKELMEHRLGEHGEPYKQGQGAIFSHIARGCIAAGTLLAARRAQTSRAAAITAGALLSAGALSARWSVFRAGFQSAADPKYVVGPQRTAIERGRRNGAARRAARAGSVEPAVGTPATAVLPSN